MPTDQIDWIHEINHANRGRLADAKKRAAMAWADLRYLERIRLDWLAVPVSQRPRRAISDLAKYYAAKSLLRKLRKDLQSISIYR